MGKWIILVVAIAIIPLVEALTLFGEEISTLILIPLILIFIFLIAFVFMIVKDKIKNKSKNKNVELANIPELPAMEALTLEEPPTKKPPEEPKLESKQTPKPEIDYLGEIEELERKIYSINIYEANKKVNELIKRFFADYAGINYNFTFEELEKELKKRNKKIRCFSDNLSSINYSPEGTSKENLIELVKELKEIIKSDIEERPTTPEFKKEVEEKKKKISILLKKGKKFIGKNTKKARENYNKISELYEALAESEKEAVRPSIMDFYNKLRS